MWIRRRYYPTGPQPHEGRWVLYNPASMRITRYRFRGSKIPTPWDAADPKVPGQQVLFDEAEFLGKLQESLVV